MCRSYIDRYVNYRNHPKTGWKMLNRLKQLERVAGELDPSASQRKDLTAQAVAYAESFLVSLSTLNAYEPDRGGSKLLEQPIDEEPVDLADLLETLDTAVTADGINPASGGMMGYIPGGGLYPAALGDFLADITNRYSGVSFASPGAAKMEQQLVRWMTGLVGYPETSGGDLTSGGSIANLTAIVTAREMMAVRARDVETSCIYVTADAHHCIDKSLRAAGLAV
jgi:aromatic-L-amino-acid decarboxylase